MRRFLDSPKRPINLSLNSAVLELAKELGLNISQTVDELLKQEVERVYWLRWNEDNKEAIAQYNARIARDGTFAQSIRRHLAQEAEHAAAMADAATPEAH